MSGSGPSQASLFGGVDYANLSDFASVDTLTIQTTQISADATVQFSANIGQDEVDSISTTPDDAELPNRARVVQVKANVDSGSTDSTLKVFQSDSFDAIDQVAVITNLDTNDFTSSYVLGGGLGSIFVNKQNENQVYFEIDELSSNASEYSIELAWYDIG